MVSELIFTRGSWGDVETRCADMFAAHWKEAGHDFPHNLDCETYRALDAAGDLRVMLAEVNGEAVGYSVTLLRPWLHCQDRKIAYVDAYYLSPEYRKGRAGIRFLDAIEVDLREAGAHFMLIGTMAAFDRSAIFTRRGFERAETIYRKDFA